MNWLHLALNSHLKLRTMEMMENAMNALYLRASSWSGNMDMVNEWKKMGFVLQKTVSFEDSGSRQSTNILQYENEWLKYDGKSFRNYFYYLMNIQDYPDFISQHSEAFFPELIGMALFLEWEVLSLVPSIRRLDIFPKYSP